jgi:hypothetical protein
MCAIHSRRDFLQRSAALALDERGRPNIGPFPCGGLVAIHSQTKEIITQRTVVLGFRAFLSRDSAWGSLLRIIWNIKRSGSRGLRKS